jgi:hypothetical protein
MSPPVAPGIAGAAALYVIALNRIDIAENALLHSIVLGHIGFASLVIHGKADATDRPFS